MIGSARKKLTNQEWIEITDRVASGESYESAATWARGHFGIAVTVRSVINATLARRGDTGAENRAVTRASLGRDLPGDLDALDQLAKRVRKIAKSAVRSCDYELALKASEAERRVLHSKLHYAGADQPDAKAESEASPRKAAELVREAFGLVGPKPSEIPDGAN